MKGLRPAIARILFFAVAIVFLASAAATAPSADAAPPAQFSLGGKIVNFPVPPGFCELDLDRHGENPFVRQVLALQDARGAAMLLWLVDCDWLVAFETPEMSAPAGRQIMVYAAMAPEGGHLQLPERVRDGYLDWVLSREPENAAQRPSTQEALAEINRQVERSIDGQSFEALDRVGLGFIGRDGHALYTAYLNASRTGDQVSVTGSVGAIAVYRGYILTILSMAPMENADTIEALKHGLMRDVAALFAEQG